MNMINHMMMWENDEVVSQIKITDLMMMLLNDEAAQIKITNL